MNSVPEWSPLTGQLLLDNGCYGYCYAEINVATTVQIS